jgi:cobalamin biosynthesis protein CobD/CbiB
MRPPARALVLALVAAAFQVVVVAANVWPASRTAPRDVPVVVAGPQRSATAVALRIETASPGAFRVERLPDEEAARQALTDRRVYGAIVVGRSGPRLLIASGAGPAVAQVLIWTSYA